VRGGDDNEGDVVRVAVIVTVRKSSGQCNATPTLHLRRSVPFVLDGVVRLLCCYVAGRLACGVFPYGVFSWVRARLCLYTFLSLYPIVE
jgi:hypothetical protein